jgi:hypothetical protein
MSIFAETYGELSANEQVLFSEAVNKLLAEGMIWYEDTSKTALYAFLRRHGEAVKEYLSLAGWQLTWHEQLRIYQVTHRDGAHRRQLSSSTTICLLLLRLLYAEQQEANTLRLTKYPAITLGDLYRRYQELPNARSRWRTQFEDALRQLARLHLLRLVGGGSLRLNNPQQVIELLPTLEVVVPAGNAQQVAERLSAYGPGVSEEETEGDEL